MKFLSAYIIYPYFFSCIQFIPADVYVLAANESMKLQLASSGCFGAVVPDSIDLISFFLARHFLELVYHRAGIFT